MIGIALALLSAMTSGLAVILVRKNDRESNAFNVSLIISCVGMIILWHLAILITDFRATNIEGITLFAISGVLSPGIVSCFTMAVWKSLGICELVRFCDLSAVQFAPCGTLLG